MNRKICTSCKIEKFVDEFHKQKPGRFGVQSRCKICRNNYNKNYWNSKEEMNAYYQEWRSKNREKVKAISKRSNRKPARKAYVREYNKKFYSKHKEYHKKYEVRYRGRRRELDFLRRRSDPQYRLNKNISRYINLALRGYKAGRRWSELVGYTIGELKKHLEKQFKDGMCWENYGEWHIDHIIPKSVFNFTKSEHEDFKRCWDLLNLQPMWAKENQSKGNGLTKPFQPSLLL